MELALVVTGVVLVVLAGSAAADRLDVPAPLLLTVVGVVIAFVPFVPDLELSDELVLIGLLPPLLYAAAIRTSLVDFRANTRPIVLLSVVLVIVSTLAVGAVAHWLLPISWPAALALGAVVSPPDAVAATSIARRVGMPRRVVTILEGESLVNDATALVSLRAATAAIVALEVAQGPDGAGEEAVTRLDAAGVGRIALDFLYASAGGLAVGVLVAVVLIMVRRRLTDTVSDTTLSLVAPWVAFLPAEELHVSGVLAVVVTGLLLGHKAPVVQSAASRISERTYWRTIQHLLENGVFLLIGLQAYRIITDVADSELDLRTVLVACGGILLAVVLVRPLWVFPALYLPRLLSARRRQVASLPWQVPAVISWAGMRGVVTLAAVFALPDETEHREVLVLAALVVAFGTLLVQGSTLPWVVRRLRLSGPDPLEDRLQEAAVLEQASAAGLRFLDANLDPLADDDGIGENLRRQVERRTHLAWERLGAAGGSESPNQAQRRLRLGMLGAERAEVLRLRDEAEVPHEVLQSVMAVLDVEESVLVRASEGMDALPDRDDELTAAVGRAGLCDHLAQAPAAVVPLHPGECRACVELGQEWVHLRMCLACGNVACCDSSRGRHAEEHFREEGHHPVMRSVEAGEAWRWCYVDEQLG